MVPKDLVDFVSSYYMKIMHCSLRKTVSNFYRRYYVLISKLQVGFKSLLHQGLSEPEFYGDLVKKLKNIVGSNIFSAQFIKYISHFKKIGYNCTFGGQSNYDWQLCFPFKLHASESDFKLYDGSVLKTYL